MQSKVIVNAAIVALLTACSVNQETTPAQVHLDAAIAKSQASALSSAVANAEADDGLDIAGALGKVGDAAAALVPEAKHGRRERLFSAASTCGCDPTAKSCTFDACTIGNATVSGTLSWSDGRLDCQNLTFDLGATSATVGSAHLALSCALTYGTGRLGGNLQTSGNAVVAGVTYTWNATIAANGVTFTNDAFTGGSVDVGASISTSSPTDGDKSFSANAVVSLAE